MSAQISPWVARLLEEPVDPRRAQALPSGGGKARREASARGRIRRIVNRAPEVMVKITGDARSMVGAKNAAAYISRNGTLPLEDERGDIHAGTGAAAKALHPWRRSGLGIPERDGHRRETLQVMLSMPCETDRDAVKGAARAWARETFGESRPWVMAAHDDTAQPHVHFVVAMTALDGSRLNPRKADLRQWRERFAAELRARGLEAEATSRAVRGSTRRHVPRRVMYASRAPKSTPEPAFVTARRAATNAQVHDTWRAITAALEHGDESDRALATEARAFVDERFSRTRAPDRPRETETEAER